MPTDTLSPAELWDVIYESTLLLGGLWLLWSLVLSPVARARARTRIGRLAAWPILVSEFLMFLWLALCGGLALSWTAGLAMKQLGFTENTVTYHGASLTEEHLGLTKDSQTVVLALAFQLGLLAGVGVFYRFFRMARPYREVVPGAAPPVPAQPWRTGAATFLLSLPLLLVAGMVWHLLLNWCGYPLEPQPLVDLMGRSGLSPHGIVLIVMAVVVAPVTEELVFRAGIFRFLRTRIPRWAALVLSAELFATLHADLPSFAQLFVLGLVFALAYERTGRIGTTMVAHALFNLNTILVLLLASPK